MPTPPVPLDPANQKKYDDLYSLFGKSEADKYALGIAKNPLANKATAPPGPTPTPSRAPVPAMAPVTLQITTGPGGRPTVTGVPLGYEPRGGTPPMQDIVVNMPSKEKLQEDLAKGAAAYVEKRRQELVAQGLTIDEAERRAKEESYRTSTVPRSTEFGAKPIPFYSDLAVRGQERLPGMTGAVGAMRATAEAFTPQVLETEEQAEGRRRFDAERRRARADIETRAKASGQSAKDVADLMQAGNFARASQLAQAQYGPNYTMVQFNDIKAALDAPLYAAMEEMRGTPPDKLMSKWGQDVLRGLTTEEKYGRLVETRGAAALRSVGGVSRYAIRGAEEAIVKPVVKGIVAATDPNVSYSDLTRMEEEERETAGGARVVSGPGVTYEKGAEARRKLDTGNFFTDVAYEIATGRSAVDDYIDAGVPAPIATGIGIATEFAIPVTPIGWVSDVAPAFGSVARAIPGVSRGIDAVSATRIGRMGTVIREAPEIIRLRSFARAQEGNIGDALRASETFRSGLSDASSLRNTIAEVVAREGADIGQVGRTIGDSKLTNVERFAGTVRALDDSAKMGGKFANEVMDGIKGLDGYDDFMRLARSGRDLPDSGIDAVAARLAGIKTLNPDVVPYEVRGFIDKVNDYVATKAKQAGDAMKSSPLAVNRVAVVEGENLKPLVLRVGGDNTRAIDPVRNKVRAEIIEAIPDDNFMFLTSRLLINKRLLKDKQFLEDVSKATENLPPNATQRQMEEAIEAVVKDKYKGEMVAEPAGLAAPRPPEILEAPRGGLERLQQPESRRLGVVEAGQDTVQTLRALVGKADWSTKAAKTFEAAAAGRVTPDVYDFLKATKSNLDALGFRLQNAFTKLKTSGVDDVLGAYVDARIVADRSGDLRGAFDPDFVDEVGTLGRGLDADKVSVEEMVSFYFDTSNLRAVMGNQYREVLRGIINGIEGESTVGAYRQAINQVRTRYPLLADAGQGKRLQAIFGSGDDGIPIATIQWIMSREAKAIYKKNVNTHIGKMYGTAEDYGAKIPGIIDEMEGAYHIGGIDVKPQIQAAINKWAGKRGPVGVQRLLNLTTDDAVAEFITGSSRMTEQTVERFAPLRKEILRELGAELREIKDYGNKTIQEIRDNLTSEIRILRDGMSRSGANPRDIEDAVDQLRQIAASKETLAADDMIIRIADATEEVDDIARGAVNDFMVQMIRPRLYQMESRFSRQFALSGFDVDKTVTQLTDIVDLPLPPALATTVRNYFGSIDDLKEMRGIIGDNAKYGLRQVNTGAAQKLWEAAQQIGGMARGRMAGGLTAGVVAPNIRYHAINFVTAPLLQAFTAPKFLLENVFARYRGLLTTATGGRLQTKAFNAQPVSVIRANRLSNDIAMTTTSGINYTFRDLNRMLDENYFGMSQDNYLLGGNALEDMAREAGTGRYGQLAEEGLRYLGVKGTNRFGAFANAVDRGWRQQIFITALKNGYTPDTALSIARNAFLDYGKIPDAVRNTVGRYMMFFSWFYMNQAEYLRAFLTPRGGSNAIKIAVAQRDYQRQFGDYAFSDDSSKKRLWADYIGDFDGTPAFDVGPENPAVSPLFDTVGPMAVSIYALGASNEVGLGDTWDETMKMFVDRSMSPFIMYMKDIGWFGPGKGMGNTVPAKSVAWHMRSDPNTFREWMDENGIVTVPYSERRPGAETFNGEQYQFVSEAAKKKWAKNELIYTMAGLERLTGDLQQMSVLAGVTPPGMDAKRFENATPRDILMFMLGGTKLKGQKEYDLYRRAMQQTTRELTTGEVNREKAEE